MAPTYDEGPEVAPQNFPEVAQTAPYTYQQQYHQGTGTPVKPEGSPQAAYTPVDTTYGSQTMASPYSQHAQPAHTQPPPQSDSAGLVCGCSLLIFILSCIIALLSAAVIGLAAGTGVEANRANEANTKLQALSSSLATLTSTTGPTKTVTIDSATATSFNDLDNGCSNNAASVNKTEYNSFTFLGGLNFTMYCGRDTGGVPLLSLFTSNFNTCMDACSAYSLYEPKLFGDNVNTSCQAVSFIPLWTTKEGAFNGTAPGNCYLKPGPQSTANLTVPNIGTECHAAQVINS